MTTSILYVSYTGLLDPLGQSQVLQYVLGLAKHHRMTLLTFEKPNATRDGLRLESIKAQCRAAGVDWHYLRYHNKPNLPATLYDVCVGACKAIKLARSSGAQVVHCRSYIAGLMGLAVKRATGARHIFDMRGFWPDERVDGNVWTRNSLPYRVFKKVEKLLFLTTDQVVSLTRAGVRELRKFPYLQNHPVPATVIPTCTNLKLFAPEEASNLESRPFTLGYIGSVGTWYMFEDVARAVSTLFKKLPDARFKVISKSGHDAIRNSLGAVGVDLSRVDIKSVAYDEVGKEVSNMDAGIFFVKPAWSKRASCPTRMGEFLACGVPCLANSGVGDVEEDFRETGTGITLLVEENGKLITDELDHAVDRLLGLAASKGIAQRCREAAMARFSLDAGITEYDAIYRRLAQQSASHVS